MNYFFTQQINKGYVCGCVSFLVLAVQNLPADAGVSGLISGSGRSPGGGHGHLLVSILACRIPWTEEFGRLLSIALHRVGHD